MSSNSRMTRSKGPMEELSLPPTRMRKDVPMREKRMHQKFKQMCRVSKGPLTRHRRLLDQGHGQAPAPHPPVKQECCQQPALHLHGPTVAQVSRHRSLHHHSPHYHLQATNRCRRTRTRQLVGT